MRFLLFQKLKSFASGKKAQRAYSGAKPYILIVVSFTRLALYSVVAYVLDAFKNLLIQARKEPFISLAALATIIYAGFAYNQWQVMRGQLDEMRVEQRPWVYADITPGDAVFRNQSGGLTFVIAFTVHNTGHLPAMYVSPDIEGYLSGEEGKVGSQLVADHQNRRCGYPVQQPGATDQLGTTVFPGQNLSIGTSFGITQSEIDFVTKLTIEKTGNVMQFMTPWGVGCVRYRSPDGSPHQTGVAFIIDRIEPGKSGYLPYPAILLRFPIRNCTSAPG